jgi:hypothetical protein
MSEVPHVAIIEMQFLAMTQLIRASQSIHVEQDSVPVRKKSRCSLPRVSEGFETSSVRGLRDQICTTHGFKIDCVQ